MIFRPLHDRVLITLDPEITESEGGIFLPSLARTPAWRGTVKAVGPGKYSKKGSKFIPTELHPGDRVLFPRHMGSDWTFSGAAHKMFREHELLAVEG